MQPKQNSIKKFLTIASKEATKPFSRDNFVGRLITNNFVTMSTSIESPKALKACADDSEKLDTNNSAVISVEPVCSGETKECATETVDLKSDPDNNELSAVRRNVQTQHGNNTTVDEENIVMIRGCPSPEQLPFEFDGVFIEPFCGIDEDEVSYIYYSFFFYV